MYSSTVQGEDRHKAQNHHCRVLLSSRKGSMVVTIRTFDWMHKSLIPRIIPWKALNHGSLSSLLHQHQEMVPKAANEEQLILECGVHSRQDRQMVAPYLNIMGNLYEAWRAKQLQILSSGAKLDSKPSTFETTLQQQPLYRKWLNYLLKEISSTRPQAQRVWEEDKDQIEMHHSRRRIAVCAQQAKDQADLCSAKVCQ